MAQPNNAHPTTLTGRYCSLALLGRPSAPTFVCTSRWWKLLTTLVQSLKWVGAFVWPRKVLQLLSFKLLLSPTHPHTLLSLSNPQSPLLSSVQFPEPGLLVVWHAGLGPCPFAQSLHMSKGGSTDLSASVHHEILKGSWSPTDLWVDQSVALHLLSWGSKEMGPEISTYHENGRRMPPSYPLTRHQAAHWEWGPLSEMVHKRPFSYVSLPIKTDPKWIF